MSSRNAALVLLSALVLLASPVLAEPPGFVSELKGRVSDESGEPLGGAVVSVFGQGFSRGARIAVTNDDGEFRLADVPPGSYRLRAYLSGFLPSAFAKVLIEEGAETAGAVLMSLAAADSGADGSKRTLDELIWLVAHGDRNILKDENWRLPEASVDVGLNAVAAPQVEVSGEFGVRAAAYNQGLDEFPGAGAGLDARLAYARVYIPAANGEWRVSAQLLESTLSSWAGRAEYVYDGEAGNELTAGVTYGNYLYGDLEDFRPPEAALTFRPTTPRSTEWFGSAYVSDSFQLGSVSVRAALHHEHFGFLRKAGYTSPSFDVEYPIDREGRTILTGGAGVDVMAPGGEDIGLLSEVALSEVLGLSPTRSSLRAERTARFRLGLERFIAGQTRVGLRLFQENAEDQLVKEFTRDRPGVAGVGYFRTSNRGDFRTRGVGLSLSQRFGATEGRIGYTFGRSQAAAAGEADERDIHDVTTVVATEIDRTKTRLRAAYRVVSHPTFQETADGPAGFAPGSKLDARFNVQVFQLLPFVGWNGTSWELMVAVRNLFYEDVDAVSILDEVAVIDAPRRVLGGVTVRF